MSTYVEFQVNVTTARREGRNFCSVITQHDGQLDPVDVYASLLRSSTSPVCLLEGAGPDKKARFSFVCFDAEPEPVLLNESSDLTSFNLALRQFSPPSHDLLPFIGGMVGYFGHESVSLIEPTVAPHAVTAFNLPKACFHVFKQVIAFDHQDGVMYRIANVPIPAPGEEFEAYTRAHAKLAGAVKTSTHPGYDRVNTASITSNTSQGEYFATVREAKKFIRKGDVFQVVLSQRFSVPYEGDGLALFRVLREINPSPYMFHMRFGESCRGMCLIGASPEVMVEVMAGHMRIRPIAGTRPRGKDLAEDIANAQDLITNQKELAEHRMLVDLARNDVGKWCEADSITIPTLMQVENYSHVMHIVSEVCGKPRLGVTPLETVIGSLPAGTLSGAPKVRALQIIAELEKSERGPYGGAFGWITDSALDTCIIIRSAVLVDGTLSWQTGGGIVADSTEEGEYNETLQKARAIRVALEKIGV